MKKGVFIFVFSLLFLSCIGSSLSVEGTWKEDFTTKTELQVKEGEELIIFGYVYFTNSLSITFEDDGFYKKTLVKKFLKFEKLDEEKIPKDFDISEFLDKIENQEDVGPYIVSQNSIVFYTNDGSSYVVQAKLNEDKSILVLEDQGRSLLSLKRAKADDSF